MGAKEGSDTVHTLRAMSVRFAFKDALGIPHSILVHQVSESLIRSGEAPGGIAAAIASKLDVNVYRRSEDPVPMFTPLPAGSDGPAAVFNLVGQYYSGKPEGSDTEEVRLTRFRDELVSLAKLLEDADDMREKPLVFPYKIGCGIAGGQWERYEAMIIHSAIELFPDRDVIIATRKQDLAA